MSDLSPFKKALSRQKELLEESLLKGTSSAFGIAVSRTAILLLESDIKSGGLHAKSFNLDADAGHPAELLWTSDAFKRAGKIIDPELADEKAFKDKINEYRLYADELRNNVRRSITYVYRNNTRALIVRNNTYTQDVVDEIAGELWFWPYKNRLRDKFMSWSAVEGTYQMLETDRYDLLIEYRMAYDLGADVTELRRPENNERPFLVDAIEFGISLIPVIGSAVAAYEAASGKDLFGYELSDTERAILAGSVLLPFAGRTVKHGRALYTASRMTALYGKDATQWSRAMALGEKLTEKGNRVRSLRSATQKVVATEAIEKSLAKDIAEVFSDIGLDKFKSAVPKAVDKKLEEVFAKLVKQNKVWKDLDALAIERVIAKGKNADHIKGQLLEELLENRITSWLKDAAGKKALGLDHIKDPLEFIPGHLVRDGSGRQITDGIIIRRVDDEIEIVAVFESKAGDSAARELGTTKAKLSAADKEELEAYAKDILSELKAQAELDGTTVSKSLDDIIKEIRTSEAGGQIRRDIERLSENSIFIGGVLQKHQFSPTNTKFFGVIPSDTKANAIKKNIKDAGIPNFEVIGVGVSKKELTKAAKLISQ